MTVHAPRGALDGGEVKGEVLDLPPLTSETTRKAPGERLELST